MCLLTCSALYFREGPSLELNPLTPAKAPKDYSPSSSAGFHLREATVPHFPRYIAPRLLANYKATNKISFQTANTWESSLKCVRELERCLRG